VLQGFGAAVSATVVRDRLIGVAFGLIVFGLVEHVLWPVRALDALRARLSEALRLLAELARTGTSEIRGATADVDSWRRRISLKMEEVQGRIESSKLESGARDVDVLQRRTGDAQTVFVLLLSLARARRAHGLSEAVQARANDVDRAVADALEALTTPEHVSPPVGGLQHVLAALEQSLVPVGVSRAAPIDNDAAGTLGLYRSLIATLGPLASESIAAA